MSDNVACLMCKIALSYTDTTVKYSSSLYIYIGRGRRGRNRMVDL